MSAIAAPTLLDLLREKNHAVLPADETVEVFVDGVRQRLAHHYSIDGGFADVYLEDEQTGGLQRDGVIGALKTKRLRGAISIRFNED